MALLRITQLPDAEREHTPLDSGVVEFELILPALQAADLEAAAHRRGLTTGQMLRRLIRDFLGQHAANGITDSGRSGLPRGAPGATAGLPSEQGEPQPERRRRRGGGRRAGAGAGNPAGAGTG